MTGTVADGEKETRAGAPSCRLVFPLSLPGGLIDRRARLPLAVAELEGGRPECRPGGRSPQTTLCLGAPAHPTFPAATRSETRVHGFRACSFRS
jgi:hypothetical protein